jgi:hypothetical protein
MVVTVYEAGVLIGLIGAGASGARLGEGFMAGGFEDGHAGTSGLCEVLDLAL